MSLKRWAVMTALCAVLELSGCSTGIFATNGMVGAGGSVRFLNGGVDLPASEAPAQPCGQRP